MLEQYSKRVRSLCIVTLIYIVAIGVGGWVYLSRVFPNVILNMLLADIAATLVVWIAGILLKNSSVYDPYWSLIPLVMLVGWLLVLSPQFQFKILLYMIAVAWWAIRLTVNWAQNWTDFSEQDWRYTMIRRQHPRLWFVSNLFGIHLMPTVIVFMQLLGSYDFFAHVNGLHWLIILGFVICISAVAIQMIADRQMANFRAKNQGKRKCIQEGLWKYSRHPNYFGEVAMWWGVYLMYLGDRPQLDLRILPPILMTCLFLFISIPMMEKKILGSRPEYRTYQRSVSILIPFFPKRVTAEEPQDRRTV